MASGLDNFGLVGGLVDAAGSIWGGMEAADADRQEAAYYKKAAQWTKYSTGIKELAANRQIYQQMGTARSDIASSGLKVSGSAADVMRSNAAQGSITRNMIGLQGEIDEQGLIAQSKAAEAQAQGAEIGGFMQGFGHIADSISGPLAAMWG